MYKISILSPSTPSFVTAFDYIYVDDCDLERFYECRRIALRNLSEDEDWLCNILSFLVSGDKNVLSDDVVLLNNSICSKGYRIEHFVYEYLNVWDCLYVFDFVDTFLQFMWINDGGRLRRITKFHVDCLTMDNEFVTMSMGEPGVIQFVDDSVESVVYLPDMTFDSMTDVFNDIKHPCLDLDCSHGFDSFIGHIVADG